MIIAPHAKLKLPTARDHLNESGIIDISIPEIHF
jgi:hypothetical protein